MYVNDKNNFEAVRATHYISTNTHVAKSSLFWFASKTKCLEWLISVYNS